MYPGGTDAAPNGPAFMDKLASLPLLWQPGSTWDYGFGLDVTGQIIEKLSGQTLDAYLKSNLFTPLGMKDTGFSVPPEKAARYARPLPADPDTGAPQMRSPELTRPVNFDSGGGGAASTAADYLRFASMLLHQGRAGNTRILGRKTVEFMTSNQLGPEVKNLIANADPTRANFGFGLGVAVKTSIGNTRIMGSPGAINWPGASGTD
jgi:CubicO group peptidase (beta-lactamase class C family)